MMLKWLVGLFALIGGSASAQDAVITAARMLDVETGRMIADPVIEVRAGRVVAVRAGPSRGAPPAATRHVDLAGLTILPGLIDMHVHFDSNPRYQGFTPLQFTDAFWAVQAPANALAMLRAGFTTVRHVGSTNYIDVGLMQAIGEGLIEGPRIVPAGYPIGATGGHCDETLLPPSYKTVSPGVGDGADALRRRVREQRKAGAEVIKVCATGGVFSRNTEPGQQQLSEVELRAVADEAHLWNLKVAAHAHGTSGIKAAIRAGIDTIEHASLIDEEGLRLAKERGTWLTLDLYPTEYVKLEGARNGTPADFMRKNDLILQGQRDAVRRAGAHGVGIVFGSDAGVMPHGEAGKQFAVLVANGMTPLAAIRTATVNAAKALGRERDVGAIRPGMWADLVAVRGDPLVDVRVLEAPARVVKGGVLVTAQ